MPTRRVVLLYSVVTLLATILAVGSRFRTASAQTNPKVATYFVRACAHDGYVNVSNYTCGDTTASSLTTTFSPADIKSQVMTVTLKNGKQFTQDMQPGTDGVIMSNVAIRKFLLPYYEGVHDKKKVAELRRFLGVIERAGPGKTINTMP